MYVTMMSVLLQVANFAGVTGFVLVDLEEE